MNRVPRLRMWLSVAILVGAAGLAAQNKPPPAAKALAATNEKWTAPRTSDGPEDLPLRLRCVTRGLPMVPTPNNNFAKIVQAPGYVVILQEMMYEARIIPISGPLSRPDVSPSIRGYMGDSIGHWEGDTLVI